ncbi:hypothetical protein [Methylobacterium gregans]|uniref:hypothetical protein n=1 Tax=Methylobacterium gregans TaxID=374424 RepID=UPI00361F344D
MLVRSLIAAALLAAPAVAQDYNRADLVRGLCQPNGCDEFRIVAIEPVRAGAEGSLKRLRVQTFHASYSGREARGEETSYVYCSPTKPAVVAQKGERTVGILLAPFATEDSRETMRGFTTFGAIYFAGCHGLEASRRAARDLRATAQSLGYRVAATRSQVVNLKRAEDLLGPAAPPLRRAPRARRRSPRPALPRSAKSSPNCYRPGNCQRAEWESPAVTLRPSLSVTTRLLSASASRRSTEWLVCRPTG